MNNTWTNSEVETLKNNYPTSTNKRMHELLPNKSDLAIYKKAYKLGIKRTEEVKFLNRSIAKSGENCNFWKGGIGKTSKGYKTIKMGSHHRADKKGYVLEHILIFEKETGVQVPKECCVHHINGIKDDNRIDNLCLMTSSAHTKLHHIGKKRSELTKKKISESRKNKCST